MLARLCVPYTALLSIAQQPGLQEGGRSGCLMQGSGVLKMLSDEKVVQVLCREASQTQVGSEDIWVCLTDRTT